MDCQMPVMDGYMATARIRQLERDRAQLPLPIVALTAAAYEEDRKRCVEAGMDDFLTKPIDTARLTEVLSKWLATDAGRALPAQPAPASVAGGAPTFDEATLLEQFAGDQALAGMIVRSAMADIAAYLDLLDRALAAGNRPDAQRAAHSIKGLSAQIGAIRLSRYLNEVEDRLRQGHTIDTGTVTAARGEYTALSAALATWLT
jgi:CheY-like chemotaxis protein